MIIVDTSNLNDKERINLPESLFVYSNDGFRIYDTDTMLMAKVRGHEVRDLLYQGYEVNGFTYNNYFCCYDYDKDWYKKDFLIKIENGYIYFAGNMVIRYRLLDGALLYRMSKYRTNKFVTFCLSYPPYKKYKGGYDGDYEYKVVSKGLSEENFLSSYKDMPMKVKLLGKKV